ncbi:MAG: hypothetical protein PUC00_06080 [Clostridiales bacterium]|nr:hypothetical protein [Clostridiales bacterium]
MKGFLHACQWLAKGGRFLMHASLRGIGQIGHWLGTGYTALAGAIRRFDVSMQRQYRPRRLAMAATLVIALLMGWMLLLPPFLGLSDDGSRGAVLADVGLRRLNEDSFGYYERTYHIEERQTGAGTTPLPLRLMLRAAMLLDTLVTGDALFDLRFLAGLYMGLYLALLYPLLRHMLARAPRYSEGLLLAAMSVLVFADSTLVVRFASLYTAPLETLALLCLADMLFVLPGQKSAVPGLMLLGAGTLLLTMVNPYCALTGIVAAIVCWRVFNEQRELALRLLSLGMALLLVILSVTYTGLMCSRQSRTAKYNQMTRGVLFQAEDPTRALAFFGIEPRFSLLADTYGDQACPVVSPEDPVLDEGFFDRYDTGEVLLYYFSHPMALLGMFERGVHQAFITRSDDTGNYEQHMGLPPLAKTPWMSLWSTFKAQSAPKTSGVLALLGAVLLLPSKRRTREERRYRELVGMFVTMALLSILTALLMAGDSELMHGSVSYMLALSIDLLVMLCLTEILSRSAQIELDKE